MPDPAKRVPMDAIRTEAQRNQWFIGKMALWPAAGDDRIDASPDFWDQS
jgi:hypothetical protein